MSISFLLVKQPDSQIKVGSMQIRLQNTTERSKSSSLQLNVRHLQATSIPPRSNQIMQSPMYNIRYVPVPYSFGKCTVTSNPYKSEGTYLAYIGTGTYLTNTRTVKPPQVQSSKKTVLRAGSAWIQQFRQCCRPKTFWGRCRYGPNFLFWSNKDPDPTPLTYLNCTVHNVRYKTWLQQDIFKPFKLYYEICYVGTLFN